jgi:hypothetical protein
MPNGENRKKSQQFKRCTDERAKYSKNQGKLRPTNGAVPLFVG